MIQLVENDDNEIEVTLFNPNGSEYTLLTGESIWFAVKRKNSTTPLFIATSSSTHIILSDAQIALLTKGEYIYELGINKLVGQEIKERTIIPEDKLCVLSRIRGRDADDSSQSESDT